MIDSTRGPSRVLRAWAMVVAGALVLAACGSSSASTSASKSETTVTIAKAVDSLPFSALDVAIEKGYFTRAGVRVKSVLLGGSNVAMASLQSNSVQFIETDSTPVLLARSKGLPVQAIASLDYGPALQMVVSNTWVSAHHLSKSEPLAEIVRGMQGATIGTVATTDKAYWSMFFKEAGANFSSVKLITISSQASLVTALQHGLIDAFLVSPPSSTVAASRGFATILASTSQLSLTKNMAYDDVVVDTDYARSHPAVVRAVATAFAEADNLIRDDPKTVLPIIDHHFSTYSPSVLQASLHLLRFARDGLQTQAMWNEAVLVNRQFLGVLKTTIPVTPGTAWTNQYINQKALAK